jgi:hypothetical protein
MLKTLFCIFLIDFNVKGIMLFGKHQRVFVEKARQKREGEKDQVEE